MLRDRRKYHRRNRIRRCNRVPGVQEKATGIIYEGEEAARNPKRIQREVRKQVQTISISTKSQQVLNLQREQSKLARKTVSRDQRETEK